MFTFSNAMACLFAVLFLAFLFLLVFVSIKVTRIITGRLRERVFLPRHWYFQDCLFWEEWFPYVKMFPHQGNARKLRSWRKGIYQIAPCRSFFYFNINPTADGLVLCSQFSICGLWAKKLLIPWSSLSEPEPTTLPWYVHVFEKEHLAMEIENTQITIFITPDVWRHCLLHRER